jgi:hypothetical protein
MKELNSTYWTERYAQGSTGWDIGAPSPPLMEFVRGFDKKAHILIPGAGNSHDWIALKTLGYSNVFALDFASEPIDRLKALNPEWSDGLIQEDFFEHLATYDLILEQTFFCALPPERRPDYVKKMNDLLKDQGTLGGVLFGVDFEREGPPFGGNEAEFRRLFASHLNIRKMEACYNSIPPRKGAELFFIAKKKG